MTFNRNRWANTLSIPTEPPSYVLSPSTIQLKEPVVAEGEVVFAADENGDIDLVQAVYETINFTVELA